MKKLFSLFIIAISLSGFSQLVSLPFSENFQQMQLPNNWSETSQWSFDNQGEQFTTANNGYIYNVINWGFTAETKELLTPFIDVSSVSGTLRLRMEQSFQQDFESFCNILITSDGGISWDTIQHVVASSYEIVNEDLTPFISGADSIQVRFSFGFTGMPAGSSSSVLRWAFDDLSIKEDVANDLAVISINSPSSGCASNDTVNITIKNTGTSVANAPFTVSFFDGNNWIDEQINQNLLPEETLNYTFSTNILLDENLTSISAKVTYSSDEDASNNEISKSLNITPSIETFPYVEDFENSNGNWFADNSTNGSWEWGTPSSSELNTGANNSQNAWVTNLSGNHNQNEKSYLYSPCYNFSSLSNPVIEFDIWYQSNGQLYGNYTQMTIEYSTDNGQSWTTLGTNYDGGDNWYDYQQGWWGVSQEWKHAIHNMQDLANEPKVQFRFNFQSYNLPAQEGYAIDNISIHQAYNNDLGIKSIESPVSNCGLSDENISLIVKNYGLNTISSFDVAISTDNSNWNTETINQVIASGSEATVDLTQTVDLSTTGVNIIYAKVLLTNDENANNDTISKKIVNQDLLSGSEINEDFESASALEWITNESWNSQTNDWELATPSTSNINGANSGSKAWVTNANGNYNINQESYVISPCMDLSNITNPAIEFYLNNHVGTSANFLVEYSVDNGTNWYSIPSDNDANPFWFHSPYTSFTFETQGYEVKRRTLTGLSILMNNINNVKFRFKFSSEDYTTAEGCAFDDFRIYQDDTLANITNTKNVSVKNNFEIYPNPAKDFINIKFSENSNNQFEIINIAGTKVKTIHVNNNTEKIDISGLKAGVYFIKSNENIVKFIKQ